MLQIYETSSINEVNKFLSNEDNNIVDIKYAVDTFGESHYVVVYRKRREKLRYLKKM